MTTLAKRLAETVKRIWPRIASIGSSRTSLNSLMIGRNIMRFIKKIFGAGEQDLSSVTTKATDTGYVFVDINNDLAQSADDIMKSSDQVKMAYGYARRVATAALRVQGLVDPDVYDHAVAIFKSLQAQTGSSVEFQEAAFAEAVDYIKSYHPVMSSLLIKNMVAIAEGYELSGTEMDDSQLLESVLETMYANQEEAAAEQVLARTSSPHTIAHCKSPNQHRAPRA